MIEHIDLWSFYFCDFSLCFEILFDIWIVGLFSTIWKSNFICDISNHCENRETCPSPRRGEVILASTRLPTWPCPDSELLALEALGRVSKLPLRLGNLTELSYASLLKTSGPFVAPPTHLRWRRST